MSKLRQNFLFLFCFALASVFSFQANGQTNGNKASARIQENITKESSRILVVNANGDSEIIQLHHIPAGIGQKVIGNIFL